MRIIPITVFLIGPLLFGSVATVTIGKSIAQPKNEASVHSFWTGYMRSEGQRFTALKTSSTQKFLVRSALKKRPASHALRAEWITSGTSPSQANAQSLSSKTVQPTTLRQGQPAGHAGSGQASNPATELETGPQFPLLSVVDQPDIQPKHRAIANAVLRMMPAQCIDALKNLYVRYDRSDRRGVAGKESIVIQGTMEDEEFRTLLVHEFGHVLDLGCLQGNPATGASTFKDGNDIMWMDDPSLVFYRISWVASNVEKEGMKPEDFVTGYASWDAFEDLAETLTYYVFQRDAFIARTKTNRAIAMKLAWIETYVFPGGATIAEGSHQWNGEVPWDSTTLPYQWTTHEIEPKSAAKF